MAANDTMSQIYEFQRKRAEQAVNKQNQEENDALSRRFAAMGGLNSGAYIKQQQIQGDTAMQRRQDALEGIGAQEAQARLAQEEAQKQREFSKSERLGSQEFAGGEAQKQRQFATGERLGQQGFQSGEREAAQKFASNEAESAFGRQKNLQAFQQDFQKQLLGQQQSFQDKWAQKDFEVNLEKLRQSNRALDLESDAQEFNKRMGQWTQSHSGGLLGAGGFLGTGLGAGNVFGGGIGGFFGNVLGGLF